MRPGGGPERQEHHGARAGVWSVRSVRSVRSVTVSGQGSEASGVSPGPGGGPEPERQEHHGAGQGSGASGA